MNTCVGEFIGVTLLIFLGCSVTARVSQQKLSNKVFEMVLINAMWGCAVVLAIYIASDLSGAHLNPVITLVEAIKGSLNINLMMGYMIAQILGAIFGGFLVYIVFYTEFNHIFTPKDQLKVLVTNSKSGDYWLDYLSEYIGTFILVFLILSLEKYPFSPEIKPWIFGVVIFILGITCGGALNPARDLGPRLIHFLLPMKSKGISNFSYAWVPILGPILGGLTAITLYITLDTGTIHLKLYGCLLFIKSILLIVFLSSKKRRINHSINLENEV